MSKEPIKVLVIEDSEDDMELLMRELSRSDYEVISRRVETESELRKAVEEEDWDVIISDYTLPQFNGLQALSILQELGVKAPFIFVSGTLGEDLAVEAMRMGAQDYIIKGNLKRFLPTIERELREAENRRQRALAEAEKEKLQEQLRQAQKMEAIGRLAGGISHDFNNLLTAILGYTEMLRDHLPGDSPLREHSEEVLRAAERAAALTRQLLAFSRKQAGDPEVLDLNELFREIEKMLRRIIGEDIEFKATLEPAALLVRIDASQIEQVIMNLVINARDAMPEGGQLIIETTSVELEARSLGASESPADGRYLLLRITDTGMGMDEETQAHLFEPFFTTKENGTGLGLANVYGIVKQSGGYIEVKSQPAQGTSFSIYLPQASEAETAALTAKSVESSFIGNETILVVEDEAGVRKLIDQILQSKGYTTLVAANGEEASELARKHPGPIDLLLTDVMLPKASGCQVADRLAAFHPGIKVLYISGYPNELLQRGPFQPGTGFLQKPVSVGVLTRKVREILDA